MEPRKFCGNAKKIEFENGGHILNGSVSFEKLKAYANDKGYVRITIARNREPGKFGNTHAIYINEWKPKTDTEQPS